MGHQLNRQWAIAWAAMTLALAAHVADEALTGFLPIYNSVVASLRDTWAWIPLPTFTFPVWLTGLVLGVLVLFTLTPLVRRGSGWLRPVSYFLGVLMALNAMGHLAASLWLGRIAPGAYSSPLLLAAAVALLVTAARARRGA